MPRSATHGRGWPQRPAGDETELRAVLLDLAGPDEGRQRLALVACRDVAGALLEDLGLHASAPGRREAQLQLAQLRGTALSLAGLLGNLHPVMRGLVSAHVAMEISALLRDADLRLVAAAIDRALAALPEGSLARPGPGNIADLVRGDPRLRLCRAAARIVIAFRGRCACSSTPGGLLYRLAAAIWTFATGEDAEAFGLERYVLAAVQAERPDPPPLRAARGPMTAPLPPAPQVAGLRRRSC